MMNKKTAIGILVLAAIFAGGGFLMWQNSQAAVKNLNSSLPEGVRVVKSMFGNEYKVVNKIDGYEFKVPRELEGLKEIEYTPEISEKNYISSNLIFMGKEGNGRLGSIDRFHQQNSIDNLESWAKTNFEAFDLIGEFFRDKIQDISVVKTQENTHLGGMYVYFFQKDSREVYVIIDGSEDYIRDIILTGKW